MDVVGHEVTLLDGRIARQAGGRILGIQDRDGALPGLPSRQLDALLLHVHITAGVRDKKAVAGHTDGQGHVILLANDEALHDEIEQILLVLGVKHDHAAVEQVGDFDVVRLNRQGRIDHSTGEHGHGREPVTGPRGDGLQSAKRARTRSGGKAPDPGSGASRDGRHHAVFLLAAIVFLHVPLAIEDADELHGLALRSNWIGYRQIDIGAPYRFLGRLAPGDELSLARRFKKHVLRRHNPLLFGSLLGIL